MKARIRRLLKEILQVIRERIDLILLRWEVQRLKLAHYDGLVESVTGLRRALETQTRSIDDLRQQLDQRDSRIGQLQAEYAVLEVRLTASREEQTEATRLDIIRRLQSVIVQLPTLREALSGGADLTADDVLSLMAPFEQAMHDLGLEPIGKAGLQTRYDPIRHHAVGRGARAIVANEPVRVRYIGLMYRGQILCKAEVTRIEQMENAA